MKTVIFENEIAAMHLVKKNKTNYFKFDDELKIFGKTIKKERIVDIFDREIDPYNEKNYIFDFINKIVYEKPHIIFELSNGDGYKKYFSSNNNAYLFFNKLIENNKTIKI